MDLQLKGKLALVTGSTAGIGFAIAGALAPEGARVIVNGRTQPAVDEAVARIKARAGSELEGFAGDLSQAASAESWWPRFPRSTFWSTTSASSSPSPLTKSPTRTGSASSTSTC